MRPQPGAFRLLLWLCALPLVVAVAAAAPASPPAAFYVARDGDDQWSGHLPAPNPDRTDGPFATLARAVAAARHARAAAPRPTLRIALQPGTYYLADTIGLRSADSGLTLAGAADGDVVLSGGRRVRGWRPWKGKILQAALSAVSLPDLDFRELYYDGELMSWARFPNFDPAHPRTGGFLQNAGVADAGTTTRFMYRERELHPEHWAHPERAWVMFHDSLNYETEYCPVKSVDRVQRVLEASQGVYALGPGSPYYVCGLLEELDAPGEWCVDSGTLYFWPPAGDPNGADEVVAPALTSLFTVSGDAAASQWVEDVRLDRLALRDCRGRAVEMTGAKACSVTACDLRNVGVGVYLGDDTHGCRVVGCDITRTQGDGVSIIGSSPDHERVADHVVDDNYIWDIGWGRIHNRCGGVYGHRMTRVKITHNHVHDTPRYAIGMDVGGDCEIAYNYAHHANLVTADTSIVEAATAMDWGLSGEEQLERNRKFNRGNSIHHNILHDSGGWGTDPDGRLSGPRFSWGVYLDTHASGWRVHDNLIYDTVLGAYMVNGGMDNLFENNLCLNGRESQAFLAIWTKYPTTGNRVERNVFSYLGRSAALYDVRRSEREAFSFDSNLAWGMGDPVNLRAPGLPKRGSWEAWRKLGQDRGSLLADPQLVDSAQPGWRLKPTSPALKLGFKPLDLSKTGNYASPDRRTWPRPQAKVVRDGFDYTPPRTLAKSQAALRDYEDYAVNETERNASVGNKADCTALVTAEAAAGGKHSLKFTDGPGLGQSFLPYVTYPLEQESGSLTMSFDFRWEQGALMALEWRDDPYTYNVGPNLTTSADGWLSANGKQVCRLRPGQWAHVQIFCGLGPLATGKYDLTVTPVGAGAQRFKDTPCSPKFTTLNCVVFMALADERAVFYVDNLAFVPRDGK